MSNISRRSAIKLLGGVVAGMALSGGKAFAAGSDAAPQIRLYELDGGSLLLKDKNLLSDTDSFSDTSIEMNDPVYLIKYNDKWLIWDTGLPGSLAESKEPVSYGAFEMRLNKTIPEQLHEIGLTPDDIDYVILSHAHMDHAANTNLFKKATLIIQKREYDTLLDKDAAGHNHTAPEMMSWFLTGEGKDNVRLIHGDTDLFGDGVFTTIYLPGHSAGHMALRINFPESGPVILAGDLWHVEDNRTKNQLPDFNANRAETLASFDRLNQILKNSGARLIIQHDIQAKYSLPPFPKYLD